MTTALAIPAQLAIPGLELPTNTATIDPATATRDVVAMIRAMDRFGTSSHWWNGDITLEALNRLRAGDPDITDDDAPVDQQTAARCLRVAIAFPPDRRRPTLTWSHHETVVSLPPEVQDRWLDRAATEGLSVHGLRDLIREAAIEASGQDALPGLAKPFTLPAPVLARFAAWVAKDDDSVMVCRVTDGRIVAEEVRP